MKTDRKGYQENSWAMNMFHVLTRLCITQVWKLIERYTQDLCISLYAKYTLITKYILFFIDFRDWGREREGEREGGWNWRRERETLWPGMEPTTQAHALTNNHTHDLSVHWMSSNQLSHTGKGKKIISIFHTKKMCGYWEKQPFTRTHISIWPLSTLH